MSVKRVSIFYLDNGSLQNTVSRQVMFNRVVNDLLDEGREINQDTIGYTSFKDGSTVTSNPIGKGAKALYATHILIDKSILSMKDGEDLVAKVIKPTLLQSDNNGLFNLGGDRMQVYSIKDNVIVKEKL